MLPILTAKQTQLIDSVASNDHNMPPLLLMENAATNISNIIKQHINEKQLRYSKIIIVCGTGNNGGDGMAIARHLSTIAEIKVIIVGNEEAFDKKSPA